MSEHKRHLTKFVSEELVIGVEDSREPWRMALDELATIIDTLSPSQRRELRTVEVRALPSARLRGPFGG